jgi:hypothetical protein
LRRWLRGFSGQGESARLDEAPARWLSQLTVFLVPLTTAALAKDSSVTSTAATIDVGEPASAAAALSASLRVLAKAINLEAARARALQVAGADEDGSDDSELELDTRRRPRVARVLVSRRRRRNMQRLNTRRWPRRWRSTGSPSAVPRSLLR